MKHKLFFSIIFSLLIVVAGCAKNDEDTLKLNDNNQKSDVKELNEMAANDMVNEADDINLQVIDFEGITFSISNNLKEKDDHMDDSFVLYIFDDNSETNFNVISDEFSEENNFTLEEFMELAVNEVSGVEYSSNEIIDVNNRKWGDLYGLNEDVLLNQKILIVDKNYYIFTYGSSSQESFNEYLDDFEEIIKSVKIKER